MSRACLTMSNKELDRLEIVQRTLGRRLTQREGAKALGISLRQMERLCQAYRAEGAQGLVSARRGRPSNRKLPAGFKRDVLELVGAHYADFGPTLAAEKLAEKHGLHVSRETLRKWMVEAGVWVPRKLRRRTQQPRRRRPCLGELIQIDGSDHAWFEDRAPRCTLLVYIDDATSRLMELRLVPSESTFSYFEATRRYLERHGKPVAFYSDKATTFRPARSRGKLASGITQFGRALSELNIDILCANTPAAKGRVERVHLTLQDRLVKELRLRGISNPADGNAYLLEYIAEHNARFAREPLSPHDAHRPLLATEDLDRIFTHQEERKLSKQLTLHYRRDLYLVYPTEENRLLGGRSCRVYEWDDGRVELVHDGRSLPYKVHPRDARIEQAEVVSNKRMGAALAFAHKRQQARDEQRLASPSVTLREKKRIQDRLSATNSAD
jgi:transposase-like protein